MLKKICLLFAISLILAISGCKTTIEGVITFQGMGLQGVKITLNGNQNLTAITDKDGHYKFENLKSGKYIITPSMEGIQFTPSYQEIKSISGGGNSANFEAQVAEGWHLFFVSTSGHDEWSGLLPQENNDGSDGPFATIVKAQNTIRDLKLYEKPVKPVRVYIRDGVYNIDKPIEFLPIDSREENAPVYYEGYPYEKPVVSGGKSITGWKIENNLWVTEIPEVKSGNWYFSSLWVNGVRKKIASLPDTDYLYTAGTAEPKNQAFKFHLGDIKQWSNLDDVVVEVFHSWATSLHRIQSIDFKNNIVTFTGPAVWNFESWGSPQRYKIHNIYEGLDSKGEWYLNKKTGILSYFPEDGETPEKSEIIAPVAKQLVIFKGDPSNGEFVSNITFKGIKFFYTDWTPGEKGSSTGQAAIELNGAFEIIGGRKISIENCEIGHIGTYGVWFRQGTQDSSVIHSEIFDMGGGGVRIGEEWSSADPTIEAKNNKIDNSFIHDGGKILSAAVGVWIGKSSFNKVTHNEICDLDYTGVSVGWSCGYAPSSANNNIISDNHIHHIGRYVLSDMGGVYTLGISPGTQIIHNLIHDVFSYGYGGWGLYTDEGSSNILIKDNLVYNTKSGNFHQHYGENNEITNNIFAFSHEGQICRSRIENHNSFNFHHNIVFYNNGWLLCGNWYDGHFTLYNNLYWDMYLQSAYFSCHTLEEWEAAGYESNSMVADPKFKDPLNLDFSLKYRSPAFDLGFVPFDLESFGLYGEEEWINLPKGIIRPESELPTPKKQDFSEGFEDTNVGEKAKSAITYGETSQATIRVTDEDSFSGVHSLKFSDAPGLDYTWDPHLYYQPGIIYGNVHGSFSLKLGVGSVFYHEWRDSSSPYVSGPSLYIKEDGTLTASGVYLMNVPINSWFSISIDYEVGYSGSGLYNVNVTIPGDKIYTFNNLGIPGQIICGLYWLGFVANSNDYTIFYLDDISWEIR